ncbi:hypothetical protein BT69DRAFT_750413 [Atractiella rhizophila]|nr:hypothetical protein BT69DRAFT_750413 [Atractiella rhizophila]
MTHPSTLLTYGSIGSAILDVRQQEIREQYPHLRLKSRGSGQAGVPEWEYGRTTVERVEGTSLRRLLPTLNVFPPTIAPILYVPRPADTDAVRLQREMARFLVKHHSDLSIPQHLLLSTILPSPDSFFADDVIPGCGFGDYWGNTISSYSAFGRYLLAYAGGRVGNELYVTLFDSTSSVSGLPTFVPRARPQTTLQTRIEQLLVDEYIPVMDQEEGRSDDGELDEDGEGNVRRFVVGARTHNSLIFVFSRSSMKTTIHSPEGEGGGRMTDFGFVPGRGGREVVFVTEYGGLWRGDAVTGETERLWKEKGERGRRWIALPSFTEEGGNGGMERAIYADETVVKLWDARVRLSF